MVRITEEAVRIMAQTLFESTGRVSGWEGKDDEENSNRMSKTLSRDRITDFDRVHTGTGTRN